MSFTLQDLLPSEQQLRTVQPNVPVIDAIDIMCQHGYSQLPVALSEAEYQGKVITFQSIVQAVQSFQAPLEMLSTRDATQEARTYLSDADLLATLDDIHRDNFVVITEEGRLSGIVTTADVAVFFRQYAEDLMVIEDIETRLKDGINFLYSNDKAGLDAAISVVSDRTSEFRRRLPNALRGYLLQLGVPASVSGNQPQAVADIEKALGFNGSSKTFEQLSFDEFVNVLLRNPHAPRIGKGNDVTELKRLLTKVRDVRNKLAHFRGELTTEERRTIRFAASWMENNLELPRPETAAVTPETAQAIESAHSNDNERPHGSYALLATHLASQPNERTYLTLSFQEIETVLAKELPRSAFEYRAWWSNDPAKPQSAAWLDEGWRTTAVSMTERRLTFVRTNDREEAYIRFFASLVDKLESESQFPLRKISPQGSNWHTLAYLETNPASIAGINASFSWRKRLRIELYLDTGERERNKALFDHFYSKREQIEQRVGEPLEWERLDNKQACRIALNTAANILVDSANAQLVDWAAKRAMLLYCAFQPEFQRLGDYPPLGESLAQNESAPPYGVKGSRGAAL